MYRQNLLTRASVFSFFFIQKIQKVAFLLLTFIVLGLLVSIAPTTVTHASGPNTYYVATNGNDNNLGTLSQPFATLNQAAKVAQAGDLVLVRGGIYYLSATIWFGNSGTATARISFQAYPNEKPILDGRNLTGSNQQVVFINGSYIDFKGFEVRNGPYVGIGAWNASHLQILNNTVHDNKSSGIYVGYNTLGVVSDITISGNTVYNNCLINSQRNLSGGWPTAVASEHVTGVVFSYNLVFQNYGEGIDCILSDSCQAYGNAVHDNFSVEMYMDNATNSVYSKNFIYTNNNPNYYRYNAPATAFQLANETYSTPNPINNDSIINNITVGGSHAFFYGVYGSGGGLRNCLIANNTFYKSYYELIHIDQDAGTTNTLFANNIFLQAGTASMVYIPSITGLNFNHNDWFGGAPGVAAGSGDLAVDPQLTNPTIAVDSGYKLQPTSPMINAGVSIANVTQDYWNIPRPQGSGYDVGATEYPTGTTAQLHKYYLPFLANNATSGGSTYNTYFSIQNSGDISAQLNITYFNMAGTTIGIDNNGGRSLATNAEYIPTLPLATGQTGSALVQSNQPLTILVTESNFINGKAVASAYSVNEATATSTTLSAPIMLNQAYGNNSTTLLLENIGSQTTQATITYYSNSGVQTASKTVSLNSNQTISVSQNAIDSNLPTNFTGWAIISSNSGQALVGMVIETNPDINFFSTVACVATASNHLIIPVVFQKAFGNFITGMNLANPNATTANVTVHYFRADGTLVPTSHDNFQLGAYSAIGYFDSYQVFPEFGGNNFVGSATVTSDVPLISLVNQGGSIGTNSLSGTFGTISTGQHQVHLPAVLKDAYGVGFNSGLQLSNASTVATSVTISFYNPDGSLRYSAPLKDSFGNIIVIPPAGIANSSQMVDTNLPDPFNGTAVVSADAPQASLIVVANISNGQFFYCTDNSAQ